MSWWAMEDGRLLEEAARKNASVAEDKHVQVELQEPGISHLAMAGRKHVAYLATTAITHHTGGC